MDAVPGKSTKEEFMFIRQFVSPVNYFKIDVRHKSS
jgi:hypothetical protein